MKKIRALLLFSGGLDSMLAAKVLQKQGIEVVGLTLVSYFFDDKQAKRSAKIIGIELISRDFSKEHLKVVKKPKYGFGKVANPCIDCHALMFARAVEIAKKKGFDIVATGEVLGQRPFSQNKEALAKVEKEAGLIGSILRPLSAKALLKTVYEKKGLVSTEKLEGIVGKNRKKQLELANEFGIEDFPTPAGGCLLTEREFAGKLFDLLKNVQNPKPSDFKLLKIGRHLWGNRIFNNRAIKNTAEVHIVLGRNKEENDLIEGLVQKGDVIIKRKDTLGPTALVRGGGAGANKDGLIEFTKKNILRYSKNRPRTREFVVEKL